MMTMMMTAATRPRSNDGDDEDIERNSTITTIRQDHDNTKINDSHCEEVDGGCEYGDEGFESDGAMSAGRGADGRGGDGSDGGDGRAGDAVDGHHVAEGGGGFLANTTSRDDGDFFQVRSSCLIKISTTTLLECSRGGAVVLRSYCCWPYVDWKWCAFTCGAILVVLGR